MFCADAAGNQNKELGVTARNGILFYMEQEIEERAESRHFTVVPTCSFPIFKMHKSSMDETLANVCKWSIMKMGNKKLIVNTKRKKRRFERLQTLLTHTAAQQSGIRKDFPQIHSTCGVS